jgi:hypothetical protein
MEVSGVTRLRSERAKARPHWCSPSMVRPASSAVGPPLRTVVLNEMRALRVRYFGAEDKGKAPQ